ncbi:MAG: hypothetical protein IKD94_02680 [Erysipelotrichaceae bacterium]|nr:hypothetical protein [Erysipelotrichaceae bacterium]
MAMVWLDDIREASKGFLSCKSVNEAKALIQWFEEREEEIELISCDHDLKDFAYGGGGGIRLPDWLVERETLYPIELHTMNVVGRMNMQREIGRYWKKGKTTNKIKYTIL